MAYKIDMVHKAKVATKSRVHIAFHNYFDHIEMKNNFHIKVG